MRAQVLDRVVGLQGLLDSADVIRVAPTPDDDLLCRDGETAREAGDGFVDPRHALQVSLGVVAVVLLVHVLAASVHDAPGVRVDHIGHHEMLLGGETEFDLEVHEPVPDIDLPPCALEHQEGAARDLHDRIQ
ncbi:MAG: hypothetical protein UU76_C0006G0004 [Parcubacteria group bacterium GW2011_GWC1_41_7]|nr:MAG: hypothetical protein UU76_C0006G0004 [Parcubacteria group bacterium GW2011_GWC1_41_7]